MGSDNVVVIDTTGARVGLAPTIEVGEGPTGLRVDALRGLLYVLNKFEASISVIDTASETEVARASFHDSTPAAIRNGRRHLYGTHETSGLGMIACASCHVDARMDRLAWTLGDPGGEMKPVSGQNLSSDLPLLNEGFEDFHPMKGPMTTQTMQDIIGKEPHHWRGDKNGLEEFNGAFTALQGDDTGLSADEMQQFEDFLATIHFPPNPFRTFDNTLPTSLDLPGHFTTGRFERAGQPLPAGDAERGLALFRPPNLLARGGQACVSCHALPSGMGTNYTYQRPGLPLIPIPPGPNGELHHALVAQDGFTNVTMKTPQLRNLYEKVGFELTQPTSVAGFGFVHDGSIDSLSRFVSLPVFQVMSVQDAADLVALLLSFSGSDLPAGSAWDVLEPPGTPSLDTHATVGTQTTLVDSSNPQPGQLALVSSMIALADVGDAGLVVKGLQGGIARGYTYVGPSLFFSDRAAETVTAASLWLSALPGSELTFTLVPAGAEVRIGIDRDGDDAFDRDELDAGSNPADPASVPGACATPVPASPSGVSVTAHSRNRIELSWNDASSNEDGFTVERAIAAPGPAAFTLIAVLPANTRSFKDSGLACDSTYRYRVHAFNCVGSSDTGCLQATTVSVRRPVPSPRRWF